MNPSIQKTSQMSSFFNLNEPKFTRDAGKFTNIKPIKLVIEISEPKFTRHERRFMGNEVWFTI